MGFSSAGRLSPKHGSQTSIERSTCSNPKYGMFTFLEPVLSFRCCCCSFILPFLGTILAGVCTSCEMCALPEMCHGLVHHVGGEIVIDSFCCFGCGMSCVICARSSEVDV